MIVYLQFNLTIVMVLHDSLDLFILEITNFTINLIFLALFIYRFVILRSFSKTDRYKDYFPKLRIFFAVVYVVINIALLIQTLIYNIFQYTAIDMVFVSLGQGIDSVILVIQLLVLRLQLLKQQPYTPFHISYFIYLCIFSITRLIIFLFNSRKKYDIYNIVLSSVLIVDSIAQLAYWIYKKQSLPQFLVPTNAEIDSLKHQSKLVHNLVENGQFSIKNRSEDNFPYIIPFVTVQNGRIKIILQANRSIISDTDSNDIDYIFNNPNKNEKLLQTQNKTKKSFRNSRQIISRGYYNIDQIKNLYIISSRFPINKFLDFSVLNASLPIMAKQIQQFLSELFKQKKWYQPSILKYFKIPVDRMKQYGQIVQKQSNFNKQTDLDQTIGVRVADDKNSIFYSISIYKHLWVYDHYQFYIRATNKAGSHAYYTIKRFSYFEDFNVQLKNQLKTIQKDLMLPTLPKKHLFHWNEDQQINQRRSQLQKYLKLLYNDDIIMNIPSLKKILLEYLEIDNQIEIQGIYEQYFYQDLKIIKGQITKSLIKNDFVTYYQFKIFQKGIQITRICKRFSQFEQLHNQLQRWMHNIQITYKTISLPERVYYKSQSIRHQKLKNYLQNIVEIHDIAKVYAVKSFFNVSGNQNDDDISQIISLGHQKQRGQKSYHSNLPNHVINEVIELTETIEKPADRMSISSQTSNRRFNHMMDNLGDDD